MSELGFLLRARNHLALKSHAEGVVVLAFGYGILAEVPEVASGAVQRALCALPGIGEVEVSALRRRITVRYDPETVSPAWWNDLIEGSETVALQVIAALEDSAVT